MTANILSAELTALALESKRKLPELRTKLINIHLESKVLYGFHVALSRRPNTWMRLTSSEAADQSLQELKSLLSTSEAQLGGDLSRRPRFIEPFLIAALSKNPKYVVSGISGLQRLAVSKALPKSRLKEVLDAMKECSNLGLDVQLKVLQALPPMLQNYPDDIRGGLLFTLLQTCSILQTSKTSSVSSTATATLQQLFSALFEKLGDEDVKALEFPTIAEVPGENGSISVRAVAYDTFRVFQDLVLMTTGGKPQYVRFSPMAESTSLELVETILVSHAKTISTHPELAHTIRSTLLPFLINTFAEKRPFSVTVRVTRLLYLIVRNYLELFSSECETILDSFNHIIEQGDVVPGWKKVLCMEVFRGIFAEPHLVLQAYAAFDQQKDGKFIIRSCTASFVRLASEKPALIGMSQQSTVPVGNYFQREANPDSSTDPNSLAGAEGTAGVGTASVPGISNQWSYIRVPCIDQLDKSDAPSLPETYIYSLVLSCLNNLAESLAKFILPLTVQHGSKVKKKNKAQIIEEEEPSPPIADSGEQARSSLKRSHSYKKRSVPINPLLLENHPALNAIRTAAALVDDCWPAILASCSTFFYASLDSEHYRALVRAFQKFAQVAGLLRMSTPRDAFLTTLGKAAVPSHVLAGSNSVVQSAQSPNPGKGGFMNVENLVSQAVSQASTLLPDRGRRTSIDSGEPTLSSRNLLCLRALLNLAIALGPTLESSWSIVFETLQQADKVMASSSLRPITRRASQTTSSSSGEPPQLQVIASEVNAIQAAVSRLFESTVDFPNDSFVQILRSLCLFVHTKQPSEEPKATPPPTPASQHRRISSFSRSSITSDATDQDYIFALSKIRELVSGNVDRFTTNDPTESGWDLFISTTTAVAMQRENPSTARLLAAELLSRLTRDTVNFSTEEEPDKQSEVQCRSLSALLLLCNTIPRTSQESDDTANEVHSIALETLRAILEQTGDSLTEGWTSVFSVIGSVFGSLRITEESSGSSLCTVSLGRAAFGSVQLVCSDFLSSVPDSCLLTLVETIYQFGSQVQDLNVSLTSLLTTTLFWKLSDLLYNQTTQESLDELSNNVHHGSNISVEEMGEELRDFAEKESKPALWILLLRRVSDMTIDPREEVRTGAIHTILRIFDNYGDEISSDAWQLCLWTILLPMLRSNADVYHSLSPTTDGPYSDDLVSTVKGHIVTSKLMLEGSSKLIASYLPKIAQCSQFQRIWQMFMETLIAYLDCHIHDLNAAVYTSLTELLSNVPKPKAIGSEAVQQAAGIWARHFPETKPHPVSNANQEALEAYIRSLKEVYRLTESDIKPEAICRIAENLELAVRRSKLPSFSSDVDSLTKLQREVLGCLSMLRTDLDGGPATICGLLARFIGLPFEAGKGGMESTGLTFVAFAKASMELVQTFIAQHASRNDIYEDSLLLLLTNLELPIGLKYRWERQGKTPCLWQKATSTLLIVLEHTVPRIFNAGLGAKQLQKYWEATVQCGRGITRADIDSAPPSTPIFEDEDFDVTALVKFNSLIVPALGSTSIPDTTRRKYTRALFESSLIHATQDSEIPNLENEPLKDFYNIRFGRTHDPDPNIRGVMAYQAFDNLISLSAKHDSSPPRVKLAQAATPYLILRAALPLKAYTADQPLRGKYMPQPQSEREEILFVLRRMTELVTEPKAIPEAGGVKSEGKRHLMRLYPLVVKVLDVAGRTARPDENIIGAAKGFLDIVGEEFKIWSR